MEVRAYRSDRAIAEELLPILFFRSIIHYGHNEPEGEDAKQLLAWLNEAECECLASSNEQKRRQITNRARRIHDQIIEPYRKQQIAVAKFGLVVYYILYRLILVGRMNIADNSPLDRFTTALLSDDGSLAELANVSRVDASAQKQARRAFAEIQANGLFQGIAWE